jgi:hypothetical protein
MAMSPTAAPARPARSPHRLRSEQPFDDGRAHRVADEHRRRRERRGDVVDVGHEIIESRDEQRLDATRPAVTAQRQRMRGVALPCEPRQKIRFPEPCIAVTTVDEEQRRLARVGQPFSAGDGCGSRDRIGLGASVHARRRIARVVAAGAACGAKRWPADRARMRARPVSAT